MRVLVTGANGFIGRNLTQRLEEEQIAFETFVKNDALNDIQEKIENCDFIVHLAGVNRPDDVAEFRQGNTDLTRRICDVLIELQSSIPIIYSSSSQADRDNPYGESKKLAEDALRELSATNGNTVFNYRLPNVFGKWSRPDYNSVVATFCNNIANDLPIRIDDPEAVVSLVYIDDVVTGFLQKMALDSFDGSFQSAGIEPVYQIAIGELAELLRLFRSGQESLIVESVGTGLTRALYSTFISYYRPEQFCYPLVKHEDPRGEFVEMLKTRDSGQVSFFSAHPGITRGGHYHHSKNEKFLVIRGHARFGFRNIRTDEYFEMETRGETPQIVETVPGWSHDITNIGDDELLVMLWANEIFDPQAPDTIAHKV